MPKQVELIRGKRIESIQDVDHLSLKTLNTPFGVYLKAGTIVHCDENETTYELLQDVRPNYVLNNVSKRPYGTSLIIDDSTLAYQQTLAITVWTINHNMGKFPSVTTTDGGFTEIIGTIKYIDNNNLTITFNTAIAGWAFLN